MKTEFYIQFQATRRHPRGNVTSIVAKRMTQKMPWEPVADSAIIRFSVDIPEAAFAIPTVTVTIPVDPNGLPIIETEAIGTVLPNEEPEPVPA